jgi:L-lactate dehydrogenase complex protein LldG
VEREAFLDNIAARLGRPRVRGVPVDAAARGAPEPYRQQPLGSVTGPTDRVERFRAELERVGGKVTIAASLAEAHLSLRSEIAFWSAERLVSWGASEFEGWDLEELFHQSGCLCFAAQRDFRARAFKAQIGITTVDRAVANTGTLALSAGPGRPRSVSLLPTVHLALVRETQLVDRIGIAFESYSGSAELPPSAVHFITGPSRTSDIENDLTIGVHGPAAVSVILWRDAPVVTKATA